MTLKQLQAEVIACRKCPRLVKWRENVAHEKVKRFTDETYWGKPLPSFGDPKANLLLVGLAPAAHGGNRTGRMFTGDRSSDWLFRALFKAGFANQPVSTNRNDGLSLQDCYITAACRCAPPQNKLLPRELQQCQQYFLQELQLLKNLRVAVGLGKVGFDAIIASFEKLGKLQFSTKPKFGHGNEYYIADNIVVLGSYHPSQQNTFTGKLTEMMLDRIFIRARELSNTIHS
jgi:uracil-DNA glycosylase family 4